MNSKAADEWIKGAGKTVERLQTLFVTVAVFSFAVLFTLFAQYRKGADYKARYQRISPVLDGPVEQEGWRALDRIYEQFPDTYIEKISEPWYRRSLQASFSAIALQVGLGAKGQNPVVTETVNEVSDVARRLAAYNVNLRSVAGARKLGIQFESLDAAHLAALVAVARFSDDERFEKELERVQDAAKFAVLVHDKIEQDRHQQVVEKGGEGEASTPNRSFPPEWYDRMRIALPAFHDALSVMFLEDLMGYAKPMDERTSRQLTNDLAPPFTTLNDYKAQRAKLKEQIEHPSDNTIKIPIVDVTIDMSIFGGLSLLMNACLIAWLTYLLRTLIGCLVRYRACAEEYNAELVAAVCSGVLFLCRRRWRAEVATVALLCAPSLLGSLYFVGTHVHAAQARAWMMSSLVVLLALTLVGVTVKVVLLGRDLGGYLDAPSPAPLLPGA